MPYCPAAANLASAEEGENTVKAGCQLALIADRALPCTLPIVRYETELEAARAYDRAVLAYVGTGAPLNVSCGGDAPGQPVIAVCGRWLCSQPGHQLPQRMPADPLEWEGGAAGLRSSVAGTCRPRSGCSNHPLAAVQFPLEDYEDDLVWMAGRTAEEVVGILRRGSVGFAR